MLAGFNASVVPAGKKKLSPAMRNRHHSVGVGSVSVGVIDRMAAKAAPLTVPHPVLNLKIVNSTTVDAMPSIGTEGGKRISDRGEIPKVRQPSRNG